MKFIRSAFGLFLGFLCTLAQLNAQNEKYLENSLYVKFKENSGVSTTRMGGKKVVPFKSLNLKLSKEKTDVYGFHQEASSMALFGNPILDKTFTIRFDSVDKIDEIIQKLKSDPNVEYVERIPIFETFSVPAKQAESKEEPIIKDPYYQTINGIDYQWYLKMIDAEGALALQQGDPDINVCVVDGAIWGEHPELNIPSSRQFNAYTMVEGNSAPPATFERDEECETIYASENDPYPCLPNSWSHGTHCAGLIAAQNDTIGMASLGSGITLFASAAHHPDYPKSVIGGYEGIAWGAQKGAKVISCSWGSVDDNLNHTGEQILKTCYDNGIIIVAAAGNNSLEQRMLPAGSKYVISVGSVDSDGKKSNFSNYGSWVNITAPGGFIGRTTNDPAILSTVYGVNQRSRLHRGDETFRGKYYDEMHGTSMATPIVAGLCALMASRNPDLTTDEVRDILQNTSTFNTSNTGLFSPMSGTINAKEAIKAIDDMKFDKPVNDFTAQRYQSEHTRLRWKAPEGNTHDILGYRIYRDGVIIDSNFDKSTLEYIDSIAPSGDLLYMIAVIYSDDYMSTRQHALVRIPERFTCKAYAAPAGSGTITGTGSFTYNSPITIKANPNEGYQFKAWVSKGDTVSRSDSYTFFLREDVTFYAIFEKRTDAANQQESETGLIKVVPNPTRDNAFIYSDVPVDNIQVRTLDGKLIRNISNVEENPYEIRMEDLKTGTYIILVYTKTGKSSFKVVRI